MFNGAHVILYSNDADADRAFIRDVLGFAHVDAGAGWLIFKLPPAEVAVHPTDGAPKHEFYLMCEDIEEVLAGLDETPEITEARWGRLATIPLPSGAELPIYQPLHPVAYNLESRDRD
ncbi:MAG TPA: extradiol dioxygenase [Pseudonocardiaceae bacterium]|jgi:catechol 2,3-dioxygenase-like lactoylglutathione lyase family enzyme|nr:extradiol dioxygenase [Pseudonocardiaceae bacterium]